MNRTALITGISGQDGSYLAQLLLDKGYQVHGYSRRPPGNLGSAEVVADRLHIHRFDPRDETAWNHLLQTIQPQELYHLAADSFVPNSWKQPVIHHDTNVGLPLRLLEAIRHHSPQTRLLNACSREVFGNCPQVLVNEHTPMNPTTLYGISKAASRWSVQAYRNHYGLFACNAILFNHESPRRGTSFVTRKITNAAAKIAHGLADCVELGNTQTERDWGYAPDFVDGMWRMLQLETPEDFVLGTGQLHSIEDFAKLAFAAAGLAWQRYVRSVPHYVRRLEATTVAADYAKARRLLNWQPTIDFTTLVNMMVEHDLANYRRQLGRLSAA